MRTSLIILFFTILIFGCNQNQFSNRKEIKELPIHIDSSYFVFNLEYENIDFKEAMKKERHNLDIERIEEKHGTEYLFRLFDAGKVQVSDELFLVLHYCVRNDRIPLDAYVEHFYLTTMINNAYIQTIKIAEYEAHPGETKLSTCYISNDLEIEIKTSVETGLETSDINKYIYHYYIENNGIIVRRK
jgi:hypothetical protein